MQRGLVITLAASTNSATDRAFSSVTLVKADTGFSGITSAAHVVQSAALAPSSTIRCFFGGGERRAAVLTTLGQLLDRTLLELHSKPR